MITALTQPPRRLVYAASLSLLSCLIFTNIAYIRLVTSFGYDDVLREPVHVILARFSAGGPALIMTWALFAWSALLFSAAAVLVPRAIAVETEWRGRTIGLIGAASGLVQAIGLLRWVFVVPALASIHLASDAAPADRAAVEVVFTAINQFGGVALGEHVGQCLLIVWTTGVAGMLWHAGGLMVPVAMVGFATVPLWVMAQTELFGTVIPTAPVTEAAPFAFTLWMIWLTLLAAALIGRDLQRRR
ncbi:DUF4386 family protein [Azospirillum griseum]|uniref:DUF4386 family protein n=1 Tax=Azospirillum griseum TaxID=2496639 RepID=A0A3S0ICY8_9PROT|nr:DUF4386 family protein [Azospirillum griseum]RTR17083.1 DUF4386 family protein [Azospirillum griseum]